MATCTETSWTEGGNYIRPSVDVLCRDGTSEISRDPRTKCLLIQRERLAFVKKLGEREGEVYTSEDSGLQWQIRTGRGQEVKGVAAGREYSGLFLSL